MTRVKENNCTLQVEIANFPHLKFPAPKISRGNREIAPYFPRDAGREAGNEFTKEKQSKNGCYILGS